jgi:hypothetical protein
VSSASTQSTHGDAGPLRIFLAGASGVIGIRLVPLLTAAGHVVAAMTRSRDKAAQLVELGGEPVVCDVYDRDRLIEAVTGFKADLVMHQLTDLPDRAEELRQFAAANDRMRTEGTRNLIAAAQAAGAQRVIAQSIAWRPPGRGEIIDEHECLVLEVGGLVIRYGQLYGPGTYYPDTLPPDPSASTMPPGRRWLCSTLPPAWSSSPSRNPVSGAGPGAITRPGRQRGRAPAGKVGNVPFARPKSGKSRFPPAGGG